MKKLAHILFLSAVTILFFLSYGFIDPHLRFFSHPFYGYVQERLVYFVYGLPKGAAALYVIVLGLLFAGYGLVLAAAKKEKTKAIPRWMYWVIGVLFLSYPAFSYDIYNYIATAKVTFLYRENPYVVMPIEIPNEPMLAYTRAANKVALYGPAWIILSSIPYLVGQGNMLASVLAFKGFAVFFYAVVSLLIYRKTRRVDQVLFFALNPLVLIEVLVSGHNDIVMMALAVAGMLLWGRPDVRYKIAGAVLFTSSVFIKGATIALVPLFFLPSWKWERKMTLGTILMLCVFAVSPLREEMYPWYSVWWLSCLAFVPMRKKSLLHGIAFWLSFGLTLRYVPWIATREYGGITPITRILVTAIPVVIYLVVRLHKDAVRYLASRRFLI